MAGRPNNTTYAILGLLAMRDWAAYELTKEMQRSLRYFWPRAESAVYVELKKLRKSGHATARVEESGKRKTTIYSITGKGRKKLQKWLDKGPRRGALLESEGMLRIFSSASFAPDPETVGAAIEALRADGDELLRKSFEVGGEYLQGEAPFQHQIRWRVFTHVFAAYYSMMLSEWCDWATTELDRWESSDEEEVRSNALNAFKEVRKRLDGFIEEAERSEVGNE
jgi:PadR family transcriptional regulator, regulatory protein AphA